MGPAIAAVGAAAPTIMKAVEDNKLENKVGDSFSALGQMFGKAAGTPSSSSTSSQQSTPNSGGFVEALSKLAQPSSAPATSATTSVGDAGSAAAKALSDERCKENVTLSAFHRLMGAKGSK